MTTRQHLIEQDCMDKLRWSVDRVASASDEEMIQALTTFDKQLPPPPPQSDSPRPMSPPIATGITHIVERLRESIRMKTSCITSDDLLTEDEDLLRSSIDTDKQTLQNELDTLRDQIDEKRIEETKKTKILNLLQTVVQSVGGTDDVLHLKEVVVQLAAIKAAIKRLKKLIG
jgi:hypothetical protein